MKNKLFYNDQFQYVEDYELWSRAAFLGKIVNLSEVLLLHRIHNDQVSKVFSEQQSINTIRVKLLLIEKLGYKINSDNIDLFLCVFSSGFKLKSNRPLINQINNLFLDIVERNREKKIFNESLVLDFWNSIFLGGRLYFYNIKVFYIYITSPLFSFKCVDIFLFFKFFLKTIFHYSIK